MFRQQSGPADAIHATAPTDGPPELTRRERDVLIALYRPMVGDAAFSQPAGISQLASELVVSESAVKFHLANLYDKFGLHDVDQSGGAAGQRGRAPTSVTVADLRGDEA